MSDEKMTLWYVKDTWGVNAIVPTEFQGLDAIAQHARYVAMKRGPAELLTKEVLVSDWESNKINQDTIESY